MLCSLTNFKLPEPDVRLVTLGDTVFKIKLRYRDNRPCRMTQGEEYVLNVTLNVYDDNITALVKEVPPILWKLKKLL